MDISVFVHSGAMVPFGLGLLFAFSNGFRDSSTIVATVVSTRALTPNSAFLLCALFEFGGALLIGSGVASTIGGSILGKTLSESGRDMVLVLETALGSAFLWGIVSWWRVWPTSNNQALVAGLTGAGTAAWGPEHFSDGKIFLVLFILMGSPLIGFLVSIVLTRALRLAGEWMTPKVKPLAESLHVLACLVVSSAHGSNDGQMVLGVLLALMGSFQLASGTIESLPMAFALRLCVALALSGGVLLGGRRILKKMGMKFFRIRDPQGLGAQMSAAATILTCNAVGFPASTTQVITGSIVGAGVAQNPRAVRWTVVQDIVLSWFITLPSVAFLSYVLYMIMKRLVG